MGSGKSSRRSSRRVDSRVNRHLKVNYKHVDALYFNDRDDMFCTKDKYSLAYEANWDTVLILAKMQ